MISLLAILAAPIFIDKTAQLGTQPCGGTGCYTNYVILADLDHDGALEVILPSAEGYYTQAQPAEPLVILKNDGAANFTDVSASAVGGFTGWLREVAIGDVNGDGHPDIVAPDAWGANAALFINDGAGNFTDEAATRWNVQTRAGSVRLADVDGDGSLDILLGDWGSNPDPAAPSASSLHLWLNDGAGNFTAADDHLPPNPFASGGRTPIDLDVLDANGDFSLDVLINTRNGKLHLYLNDGTGHFTEAAFPAKPGPYSYNPGVCDVDGDGDLDIWVDNAINAGDPQLLINDGTGTFTDETSARVDPAAAGQDDNGVACVDIDGDGDFDAVIMSLGDGSAAANNERVLINDGTGHFALMAQSFPLVGDSTLGMDFGDLDGDGRIDAVTGQGESGSFTNRLYLGTAGVAVDTRAPVFRDFSKTPATVGTAATPSVRVAIEDVSTTDTGPRLSAAYVEWTGAGPIQPIDLHFAGGDLFQAVFPARGTPGTVSWRACATDWAGNNACTPMQSYQASGGGSNPGGGGGGGCKCEVGAATKTPWLASLAALGLLLAARRRARPAT